MRVGRVLGAFGVAAVVLAALAMACGDRNALPTLAPAADASFDPMSHEPDSSPGIDARDAQDAAPDVPADVPFDTPFDIATDIPVPNDCPDAAATLVYVITMNDELYSFYPPTASFSFIGKVSCTGSSNSVFSMAVDRKGIAYVLFQGTDVSAGGPLFRVDTASAACQSLPYVPGQDGLLYFGMGFATNGAGPSETLYLQGDTYTLDGGSNALASLDTTTWTVTPIGAATPSLSGGELTGTGGGDLFAFFKYASDPSVAHLGQIDKTTGQLVSSVALPAAESIARTSFAVAFWGGDFYLFTDGNVAKYSPKTGKTQTAYASLPGTDIVGAGVSTCAPL